MSTKTLFLLLLISISFFSCNSTVKNAAISISNLDGDFQTTEKLECKPFKKYDVFKNGFCIIDDSTLWYFTEGESDFGSCYNLITGEKLGVIASRGRAANELTYLEAFEIVGDSVHFYSSQNIVKSFAKKDAINNVPMGDRKFSVMAAPDSILTYRMTKLLNGSILATIQPALEEFQQSKNNEFNQKSIAIFNNKEANSYETINYESFDVGKAEGAQLAANDLVKYAYSNGLIRIKGNDMAVFSISKQFILYTFDIKNGNVANEVRYTSMQRAQNESAVNTVNDWVLEVEDIKTSDKYILCKVYGYLNENDKKSEITKRAIFVFDWELNPVKKFDLPQRNNGYYTLSNDCKSVYFCEYSEDGLMLDKSDLNI